jgi:dolichol-phosphate mannosyltransferase
VRTIPARPLVVLPTYNEADNIELVLRLVRDALPAATVLVVDDGSPDGTADLAEEVGAQLGGGVEVLRRPAKAGLGSAYRAGFRWGIQHGHDALIEMDSDLQHDPAALPSLLAPLGDSADLVVGSRYVPGGSTPSWAWHRLQLSRWGNRYAGWVLGIKVRDATSGFRAYRADLMAKLDLESVRADGYGFQIEMCYETRRVGGTIAEVPIKFGERERGASKMSSRIIVEALLLVTWWGVRDRVLRRRRRP